jgi:site-specific DNA recombinase
LLIDKTLCQTYRYIIDSVVTEKKSTNQIAYELNNKQWYTKSGNPWTSKTVRDTLLDKTPLDYDNTGFGCIVIGKSRGNAHKVKSDNALKYITNSEDEWKIFKGQHKALKTQAEQSMIEQFLKRNTKAPRKTTAKKIFPLTGLIQCSYCGHYLGFTERTDRKGLLSVKKCWYVEPNGKKCPNRGCSLLSLIVMVNQAIEKRITNVIQDVNSFDRSRISKINQEIAANNKLLSQKTESINRICDAYEAGAYDVQEFKERKSKLNTDKVKISNNIKYLMNEREVLSKRKKEDRINLLKEFQKLIQNPNLTWEQQNELYKTIIDYISYKRIGDNVELTITYK